MARKLRLEFPGAGYHVINRGNYRRDLFGKPGTAESFEKALLEACERFGWRLHAFVIMRNHFHLAVELTEPNLAVGMKWLQGTFATRFNRYYRQVGRPFQGRYKALMVEPGEHLGQVCHYIHLNPVRAHLVSSEGASEYRWSSLFWYKNKDRPACLEPDALLAAAGGLADSKAGWGKYAEYLDWLATDGPAQKQAAFDRMCKGWCIGSTEYRSALLKDLATVEGRLESLPLKALGAHRDIWRELREQQWAKSLEKILAALGLDLRGLPNGKCAPAKVRVAALMRATTSVSNGWLADKLKMGRPATVSQCVRRFRLEKGEQTVDYVQALSTVNS
jgi:putative transposase